MILVQKEWARFCKGIDSTKCVTISELPNLSRSDTWIAIKHDVETNVERALQIATIEANNNIKATYFVQSYLLEDNKDLLSVISNMGHEVTYHYDVLDANNGNFEEAINEFGTTVRQFEASGFPVQSICPHGNPMMNRNGWNSNKDFFRSIRVVSMFSSIFDIVVQGEEKIKREYLYISDAGYGFKIIGDIRDNDYKNTVDEDIDSVDSLIDLTKKSEAIVISTHPHRWGSSYIIAWFMEVRFHVVRKLALLASRSKMLKLLLSRFYFLAKKF